MKQLDLGEGAIFETVDFEDHLIFVPVELTMDKEVDLKALGAWVIMKSFGKRADASLGAYAERAHCEAKTFRAYQRELEKAGWITLLREGKQGGEENKGNPRLWWMSKVKKEAPPLGAFLGGGGSQKTAPSQKTDPSEKRDPKQGLSSNYNSPSSTSAAKPPWAADDGSAWKTLTEAFEKAWRQARASQGPSNGSSEEELKADFEAHLKKGVRALSSKAKSKGFTLEAFKARLANMPAHDFHAKQDFSLVYFLSHYSEFADGQEALRKKHSGRNAGAAKGDW